MTKKSKTTSLVVQSQSAELLIGKAIEKGVSVETLERLFELDKKWKADRAKEAFFEAMSNFQGECPVIKKSKTVMNKPEKGGGKRYSYAPLDEIVKQVGPIISKHGLSFATTVVQDEKTVEAKIIITHIAGHSETSSFRVPVDSEAFMTSPQKFASALTFAKRYAFCNAFGILTGDEDNDATTVEDKKRPKETKEETYQKVVKMLNACKSSDTLIAYSEKLAKKESSFTKEQVAELQKIISQRVNELEKPGK